jgi:hypothetical protein
MKWIDWFEGISRTARVVIFTLSCTGVFATSTWPQTHRPDPSTRGFSSGGHIPLIGKAAYVGGTLAQFQYATDRVDGRLDFGGAGHFLFTPNRNPTKGRGVRIAYESIQDLQFGQKVSRRLVTTMGAVALAGPIALLTRPASRRHYLTITFLDEERRSQVVILELGKETVRATLSTLEACSGKPIEYQDDEARKWIGG